MLEVEIKAYCTDLAQIRNRVTEMGGEKISVRHDRDRYFNHPSRDFALTDEAFRIRSIGEKCYLTYKGPKLSTRSKARVEEEVSVGDGNVAGRILQALSFEEVLIVEKKREVWKIGDIEICLDEIDGLGTFVELEFQAEEKERAEEELFKLACELGLEDFETRSYMELIIEKDKE